MRKLVVAAVGSVGLIGAIIAGLLLAELVDTVGFPLFDRAAEIWLLPVVLGIGGTVAARVLDAWT
jgi:hypothetical protein